MYMIDAYKSSSWTAATIWMFLCGINSMILEYCYIHAIVLFSCCLDDDRIPSYGQIRLWIYWQIRLWIYCYYFDLIGFIVIDDKVMIYMCIRWVISKVVILDIKWAQYIVCLILMKPNTLEVFIPWSWEWVDSMSNLLCFTSASLSWCLIGKSWSLMNKTIFP